MKTLGRIITIFIRATTSCFLSCASMTFWKRGLIEKERIYKFFPFRVDPLSEGRLTNFDRVDSIENASVLFKSKYGTELKVKKMKWFAPWKMRLIETIDVRLQNHKIPKNTSISFHKNKAYASHTINVSLGFFACKVWLNRLNPKMQRVIWKCLNYISSK